MQVIRFRPTMDSRDNEDVFRLSIVSKGGNLPWGRSEEYICTSLSGGWIGDIFGEDVAKEVKKLKNIASDYLDVEIEAKVKEKEK